MSRKCICPNFMSLRFFLFDYCVTKRKKSKNFSYRSLIRLLIYVLQCAHSFFTANNASRNFSPVKCVKFEAHALRPGIKACRHFETFIRSNTWQFSLLSPTPALLSFILFFFRARITYCAYGHGIARIHEPYCVLSWLPVKHLRDEPSQDLHDGLELHTSRAPVFMAVLELAFLNRPTYWSKLADSLNKFLFELIL